MSESAASAIFAVACVILPLSAYAWYVLFSRRWAKPSEFEAAYLELGKMYDEMLNKTWELRSENCDLRAELRAKTKPKINDVTDLEDGSDGKYFETIRVLAPRERDGLKLQWVKESVYNELLNKIWELNSENARLRAEVSRLEGRVVELVEEVSSLMGERENAVEHFRIYHDLWAKLDEIMVDQGGMDKKTMPEEARVWLKQQFDDLRRCRIPSDDSMTCPCCGQQLFQGISPGNEKGE